VAEVGSASVDSVEGAGAADDKAGATAGAVLAGAWSVLGAGAEAGTGTGVAWR
jgi:hypothetical protein